MEGKRVAEVTEHKALVLEKAERRLTAAYWRWSITTMILYASLLFRERKQQNVPPHRKQNFRKFL